MSNFHLVTSAMVRDARQSDRPCGPREGGPLPGRMGRSGLGSGDLGVTKERMAPTPGSIRCDVTHHSLRGRSDLRPSVGLRSVIGVGTHRLEKVQGCRFGSRNRRNDPMITTALAPTVRPQTTTAGGFDDAHPDRFPTLRTTVAPAPEEWGR